LGSTQAQNQGQACTGLLKNNLVPDSLRLKVSSVLNNTQDSIQLSRLQKALGCNFRVETLKLAQGRENSVKLMNEVNNLAIGDRFPDVNWAHVCGCILRAGEFTPGPAGFVPTSLEEV
jgi:hypothetical protein